MWLEISTKLQTFPVEGGFGITLMMSPWYVHYLLSDKQWIEMNMMYICDLVVLRWQIHKNSTATYSYIVMKQYNWRTGQLT